MGLFGFRKYRRKKHEAEIYPDEIFLDASNIPQFDTDQFEGRIERPIDKTALRGVATFLILAGVILGGKLWSLQMLEGEALAYQSEQNRLEHHVIFADRGVIYDRRGEPLVVNRPGEGYEFPERDYVDVPGLAHIVGYVSYPKKDSSGVYYQTEYIGQDGIEESFDDQLAGENGLRLVEVDALGRVRSENAIERPKDGDNLTLSIDARVQAQLYREIASIADEHDYQGGAGAIVNIENGELLALASVPEYNPDVLAGGGPQEEIQRYVTDTRTPFLNRATAGLYTPGSIIKPFLALAALEEGIISPEKEIESTGSITVPNPYFPDKPSVFRDWKAHGFTDMREAIAVSSDVYFYEIGGGYEGQEGLGIKRIEDYVRRFGIAAPTGVELEREGGGTIPTPAWKAEHFDGADWLLGNTYHTAIGQYGFQVTPLQMARATAAIANDGVLLTPTLEKDKNVQREQLSFNPEHLQVVREGMRMAVTDGTASALRVPYVDIAAKTGTAEVGASKEFINAWIIGFFPYENPRYAFAFLMERGPAHTPVGGAAVGRYLFDWMAEHTPEYFNGN